MSGSGASRPPHPAGLCAVCAHHRTTGNRRGSLFYLCERSRTDPSFRRYPPLPMIRCRGFEPGGPNPWAEYEDDEEVS